MDFKCTRCYDFASEGQNRLVFGPFYPLLTSGIVKNSDPALSNSLPI